MMLPRWHKVSLCILNMTGKSQILEDLPLPVATCGKHIQKKARPRCLPTWDLYCELVKKKATRGAAPRDVETCPAVVFLTPWKWEWLSWFQRDFKSGLWWMPKVRFWPQASGLSKKAPHRFANDDDDSLSSSNRMYVFVVLSKIVNTPILTIPSDSQSCHFRYVEIHGSGGSLIWSTPRLKVPKKDHRSASCLHHQVLGEYQ